MVFDIQGKVALITGGASGLGLEYAKELIRHGVKGVTLADINPEFGEIALSEIIGEFGDNKAVFIKTDTTDIKQFEGIQNKQFFSADLASSSGYTKQFWKQAGVCEAFKKTVETFNNVDILINNAGILNDAIWEREVSINVNGVISGMLLGLENYLPKYKQGEEAVIVNISSTCGLQGYEHIPIYCGTKFAILGITKSWGTPYHYERTGVRVIAVCPGVTDTPLISDMAGKNLGEPYEKFLQSNLSGWLKQGTEYVAKQMIQIIKGGPNGTIWVVEGGEPAYEYYVQEREKLDRKYLNV